jgi:hypothetical protein
MLHRLICAGAALVLLAGCQSRPGAGISPLPESASWRQPEGSYVFNDGNRRYAIELDNDWTVASSIERGAYALNANRTARAADDQVTQLQARLRATSPRREVAVLTAGFSPPGTAAADQAKLARAAEQAKCADQAMPEIAAFKTKDGHNAYIVLRCKSGAAPASAVAFVDDSAVAPSLVIVHGVMSDYAGQPILQQEVIDEFIDVVKSYKSVR